MGRNDRSKDDELFDEPSDGLRSGKSKSTSLPRAQGAEQEAQTDAKPVKYGWKAKLLNMDPGEEQEEPDEPDYEEQEHETELEEAPRKRRSQRSRSHRFGSEDGLGAAFDTQDAGSKTSSSAKSKMPPAKPLSKGILAGKAHTSETGQKARSKKKVAITEQPEEVYWAEQYGDEGDGGDFGIGGHAELELRNDRSQSSKAAMSQGAKRDHSKPLGWSFFQQRDASEGAARWDEVDESELKYVAERLVASTTKATSTQGDEVIAEIFKTTGGPGGGAAVKDPLGRGYVNPASLTLSKTPPAARKMKAASGKGLGATLRSFQSATQSNGGDSAAAPSSHLQGLLPDQEGFDPEAYLGTFHADTSLPALSKGMRALQRELSERTGQLQKLIRTNFDRFISCKDAIDDIHLKLRKLHPAADGSGSSPVSNAASSSRPAHAGSSSSSMAVVLKALDQLQSNAARVLGPVLERAARAERMRSVSGLLTRFSALFGMPARVRQLAEQGDMEQVVHEYRRAVTQIKPTASTGKVWVSLYTEVEKRVTDTYTAVRLLVTSDPREFLDDYFVTGAPSTSAVMASSGAASSTPSVGFARTGSIGRPLGRPSIKYATAAGAGSSSSHGVGSSSRRRREADGKGASEVAGSSAQGLLSTGPSLGELLSPEALAAAEQLPQLLMFMAGMRCEKLPIAREDDCVKTYMAGVQARVESGVKAAVSANTGAMAGLVKEWLLETRDNKRAGADVPPTPTAASASEEDERTLLLWLGSSTADASRDVGRAMALGHSAAGQDALLGSAWGAGGIGESGLTVQGSGEDALPLHLKQALSGWRHMGFHPSQLAPPFVLTPAQAVSVSLVCSLGRLLETQLAPMVLTASSPRYAAAAGVGELPESGLELLARAPALARKVTEAACTLYADRMSRAVDTLIKAGAMQLGLPLAITDACRTYHVLQSCGCDARALAPLKRAIYSALAAADQALAAHLSGLPPLLLGAEDFSLDPLTADSQPVTSLPRRLEVSKALYVAAYNEELGAALSHHARAWERVVMLLGHPPAAQGWQGLQRVVLEVFELLSSALAEYAQGLAASERELRSAATHRLLRRLTLESQGGDPTDPSTHSLHASRATRTAHESHTDPAHLAATGNDDKDSTTASRLGAKDEILLLDDVPDEDEIQDVEEGGAGVPLLPLMQGGAQTADVRILMVISNSAAIRLRLLPALLERHKRLLAASAEAATALARSASSLTRRLRASNQALGSAYLERKEQDLAEAVQVYMSSQLALAPAPHACTNTTTTIHNYSSTPAMHGVNAAGPGGSCQRLLLLLLAIHNEALTYSPSNLRSFLEALTEQLARLLVEAVSTSLLATHGSFPHGGRSREDRAGRSRNRRSRRSREDDEDEDDGAADWDGKPSSGLAVSVSGQAQGQQRQGLVEMACQVHADLLALDLALMPLMPTTAAAQIALCRQHLAGAVATWMSVRKYQPASPLAAYLLQQGVAGTSAKDADALMQSAVQRGVNAWAACNSYSLRCFVAAAARPAAAGRGEHGEGGSSSTGRA